MSQHALTARVDAHWTRFLGVAIDALSRPGVTVTGHAAALASYHGVWCFMRGQSCVVSAPAPWLGMLRAAAGASAADAPARLETALGTSASWRVGPSYQGWLPPTGLEPAASRDVRELGHEQAAALEALRSAASPLEWEHGGLAQGRAPTWGAVADGRVVALGQLRSRADGVVDPCVITHPGARGGGAATRVVSAMCERALSRGALVLYQTLFANAPAVAVARRLGFEHYATLVAISLRPGATPES